MTLSECDSSSSSTLEWMVIGWSSFMSLIALAPSINLWIGVSTKCRVKKTMKTPMRTTSTRPSPSVRARIEAISWSTRDRLIPRSRTPRTLTLAG